MSMVRMMDNGATVERMESIPKRARHMAPGSDAGSVAHAPRELGDAGSARKGMVWRTILMVAATWVLALFIRIALPQSALILVAAAIATVLLIAAAVFPE